MRVYLQLNSTIARSRCLPTKSAKGDIQSIEVSLSISSVTRLNLSKVRSRTRCLKVEKAKSRAAMMWRHVTAS